MFEIRNTKFQICPYCGVYQAQFHHPDCPEAVLDTDMKYGGISVDEIKQPARKDLGY